MAEINGILPFNFFLKPPNFICRIKGYFDGFFTASDWQIYPGSKEWIGTDQFGDTFRLSVQGN